MAGLLFILAVVLFSARFLLLLLLQLFPGGVDPIRDPVSDYAMADARVTRKLSTAASWAAATAWSTLGSAVLLHTTLGGARAGLGVWLVTLGLILAVMPLVPTDRTGSQTTLRGRVHLLFAVVWFTLAYSTIGPLGQLLCAPLGQVLSALDTAAGLTLAALVVALIVRPLRNLAFGIVERAFIFIVTVAPLIASAGLAFYG